MPVGEAFRLPIVLRRFDGRGYPSPTGIELRKTIKPCRNRAPSAARDCLANAHIYRANVRCRLTSRGRDGIIR